jgi:hypothetical protein
VLITEKFATTLVGLKAITSFSDKDTLSRGFRKGSKPLFAISDDLIVFSEIILTNDVFKLRKALK